MEQFMSNTINLKKLYIGAYLFPLMKIDYIIDVESDEYKLCLDALNNKGIIPIFKNREAKVGLICKVNSLIQLRPEIVYEKQRYILRRTRGKKRLSYQDNFSHEQLNNNTMADRYIASITVIDWVLATKTINQLDDTVLNLAYSTLNNYVNKKAEDVVHNIGLDYRQMNQLIKMLDVNLDCISIDDTASVLSKINNELAWLCHDKILEYETLINCRNNSDDYMEYIEDKLVKRKNNRHFNTQEEAIRYILDNDYPDEIKEIVSVENSSDSSNKLLPWLRTIINYPFNNINKEEDDIKKFKEILDNSHYGMDKVKERIVESVIVKKRTDGNNSPILCLVGSPGVGKTSIVKAVAKALGVPFEKISMSGANDVRVLKGFHKGYVGSSLGWFGKCIYRAGCINPVILIDEIEKSAERASEGNPVDVLLEALDPSQNNNFIDEYLGIGIDLSRVTFICTANYPEKISAALKDRMEMIYLPDYNLEERKTIFEKYVLPSKMEKHNLNKDELFLEQKTIDYIIENYSVDGGIRSLEKCADTICRKACAILQEGEKEVLIDIDKTKEYLGDGISSIIELQDTKAQIGVANAIAVNGLKQGCIHKIECVYTKGNGQLKISGNLSTMTKESCEIALEYVKWKANDFGIDENFFLNHDIHVHFTKSAIPKDGNSAGVAFVTAIISAIKNQKTIDDISLTGEISLRGNVSSIGGLKEKITGAKQNGIKKFFYPASNQKEIDKLDKDIIDNIKLISVDNYEQIYNVIFS